MADTATIEDLDDVSYKDKMLMYKADLLWWEWWTEGSVSLERLYPRPGPPRRPRGERPRRDPIPAAVKVDVLIRDGCLCRHCGKRVTKETIEFDHYPIPFARGGTNTAENIVVSCRPCNRARGAALLTEMAQERRRG